LIVISNFNLDLPSLGMVKCVPQRLSGDPVSFVAQDRMQVSHLAFNRDAKCWRAVVAWVVCEFLSESVYCLGKVVRLDG